MAKTNPTGTGEPMRTLVSPAPSSTPAWRQTLRRFCLHLGLPELARAFAADPPPPWRYRQLREINRGGMGTIYRVLDSSLSRYSAMKVALPFVAQDPENVARFINEARITSQLEHPNIVPVHDLGETPGGGCYFTMKLVEGEPLSRILDRLKESDPAYLRRYDRHRRLLIFHKVCNAVAFAHARGVIHRDIKPENVMVGAFGEVLLMDWGLAKRLEDPDGSAAAAAVESTLHFSPEATQSGIVKGTPAYMSPEQASGRATDIDRQTDIFLLGAFLYHLVTFQPPYTGISSEDVIAKAERMDVPHPQEVCPQEQIPDEICRIIAKAMAPEKKYRYANVDQLLDDLDALMTGRNNGVRRSFAPGAYLMRSGERGHEGYVILSGAVDVLSSPGPGLEQVRLCSLAPGDMVGEMAVLSAEARSADVVATEPTEVEVITGEVIQEEMRKLPPWMGKILNTLASRLRVANQNVHPLLLGNCSLQVAKQLHFLALQAEKEMVASAPTLGHLSAEIGQNLGIPPNRIAEVLQDLSGQGLLEIRQATGACVFNSARLAAWLKERRPRSARPPPEAGPVSNGS